MRAYARMMLTMFLMMSGNLLADDSVQTRLGFQGGLDTGVVLRTERPAGVEAVAVYAYPSNTLVALYTNGVGGRPGRLADAWVREVFPQRPDREATFAFAPGLAVLMQAPEVPATDTALRVRIHGSWGAGLEDRTFVIALNPNDFNFAITHTLGGGETLCCNPNESGCRHDCMSGGCGEASSCDAATRPTIVGPADSADR